MAPDLGERVASLEAEVRETRRVVNAQTAELLRSRDRLHGLEGTTRALVLEQRQRSRDDRKHQKKIERRLNVLAIVVAAAGVVLPLLHGGFML